MTMDPEDLIGVAGRRLFKRFSKEVQEDIRRDIIKGIAQGVELPDEIFLEPEIAPEFLGRQVVMIRVCCYPEGGI